MSTLVRYILTQLNKNPVFHAIGWLFQKGLLLLNYVAIEPLKYVYRAATAPFHMISNVLPRRPLASARAYGYRYTIGLGKYFYYNSCYYISQCLEAINETLSDVYWGFLHYLHRNRDDNRNMREYVAAMRYWEITEDMSQVTRLNQSYLWDPAGYVENWFLNARYTALRVLQFIEVVLDHTIVYPARYWAYSLRWWARYAWSWTGGGLIALCQNAMYYAQDPPALYYDGVHYIIDQVCITVEEIISYPYMYTSARFYGVFLPFAFGLYLGYHIQKSYWAKDLTVGELKKRLEYSTPFEHWVKRWYDIITNHKYFPTIISAIKYYGIFVWCYLWVEKWFVNGSPLGVGGPGSIYRNVPDHAADTEAIHPLQELLYYRAH